MSIDKKRSGLIKRNVAVSALLGMAAIQALVVFVIMFKPDRAAHIAPQAVLVLGGVVVLLWKFWWRNIDIDSTRYGSRPLD